MNKLHLCLVTLLILSTSALAQTNPYPDEQENADYAITVKYSGPKPGLNDFINALLAEPEDELIGSLSEMWQNYLSKKSNANEKVTVDAKNGYACFEKNYEDKQKNVTEICYWNCSNTKYKLVALSSMAYMDGKPVETELTGLTFYIYNTATHSLTFAYTRNIVPEFNLSGEPTGITYTLPRVGKDIKVTVHYANSNKEIIAKWNGLTFDLQK
ncbi:MAG: hypothetical protein K6F33_05645 [Bacteroidales bacterium]|nr:hypothetical protein [Bacteroidales bacterium]